MAHAAHALVFGTRFAVAARGAVPQRLMEAADAGHAKVGGARFAVITRDSRRERVACALRVAEVDRAGIAVVADELADTEAAEAEVVDGARAKGALAWPTLAFCGRHAQGRSARNIRAGVWAW